MFLLPKPFVAHKDGNILLTGAERAGWQVTVTHGPEANLGLIAKNGHRYQTLRGVLAINNSVATQISKNKYLTNTVLKDRTPFVTHPELWSIADVTDQAIQKYLDTYTKVVVKPVNENEGVGVTTSLTSIDAVKRAIDKIVSIGHRTFLIENHVETVNEYRVMLWKDKVIDILHRTPAYVIGDGRSTVEELVVQKNEYRVNRYKNVFPPIKMDQDYHDFLARQDMSSTSVLKEGKHFTLETTCNLAQGGETERVDLETVHPAFFDLFKIVFEVTNLNHCGVDVISPNLTDAPIEGKTAINELNSAPGCTAAYYADLATDRAFYGVEKLLNAIEQDPPQY